MPMIPYNAIIPQADDEPSQSQPIILSNFTGINDIWNVNHFRFDSANAGKHKFCSLVTQAPAPAAAADEFQIYTKNNATSTFDELYLRRASNSGQKNSAEVPWTAFSMSNPASTFASGYTWLPSGLLLKYGVIGQTGNPGLPFTQDIDLSAAPAFVGRPLSITFSPIKPTTDNDPNIAMYLEDVLTAPLRFRLRFILRATNVAVPINYRFSWTALGQGI